MLGDQHRQSYLCGETEDRPRPAAVGLGGLGAGSRRLWSSRVTNETLTRNRLRLDVGSLHLHHHCRDPLPEIHRMGPMASLLLSKALEEDLASPTIIIAPAIRK